VQNYTYPLDYYKILFTGERWAEIMRVLDHWEHPKLEGGGTFEQLWRNPETGYSWHDSEKRDAPDPKGHAYDFHRKGVLGEYLKGEELEKLNSGVLDLVRESREKRILEKAERFKPENWDGPVFSQSGDFYMSVDDYLDYADEDERDSYIFASEKVQTLEVKNLAEWIDDKVSQETEGLEDSGYGTPGKIPDDLMNLWEAYVERNAVSVYWEDSTKIIILEDENTEG
jgi:hypothetical protein